MSDFKNLKIFMDMIARCHSPGNAVEVYVNGKRLFRYASGYNSLEKGTPLTGDEMFNIYSCSKITTVTAGMQLLEQGRFLLTDPLYEYIPQFRDMYVKKSDGSIIKAKNHITIGDLFTMTAGFTYDMESDGFKKAYEITGGTMDTVETIKCVANDPLSFEPGTHWQYSIGHDVLAAVISVITGKKFRDYVRENIFEPLEMNDSVYHHNTETLKRTAEQYAYAVKGNENFDIVEAQKHSLGGKGYFENVGKAVTLVPGEEYDSGGAGIITTVSDYAKFAAALANYGTGLNGERILSPASIRLMRINRLDSTQLKDYNWQALRGCGYGLGVRVHLDPAKSGVCSSLTEFGWGGAAGASVIIDPEYGLGVFYVQHTLHPREEFYQPRLKNAIYSCL